MRANRNIAALILGCTTLVSCSENFEKINTDPVTIPFGQLKASNLFEPILFDTGNQNQYYSWFWNAELIQVTAFLKLLA